MMENNSAAKEQTCRDFGWSCVAVLFHKM